MKIIFLDIDGVMISINDMLTRKYNMRDMYSQPSILPSEKLGILKKIVEQTGSEIVLSSTWGMNANLSKAVRTSLNICGMELYSIIPFTQDTRGACISQWIIDHESTDPYVILDDDEYDMEGHDNHVVRINSITGLTEAHISQCVSILNQKP